MTKKPESYNSPPDSNSTVDRVYQRPVGDLIPYARNPRKHSERQITQIAACENLERRCFAIEIDPKYCDVSIRRWQEATGKKAVRDSDGIPFDELASLPRRVPRRRGREGRRPDGG